MSSNINNIDEHQYDKSDKFFFDANIWLYIYGPVANVKQQVINRYSFAWKRILSTKCKIYVDVLILSEFINRFIRLRKNVLPEWKEESLSKYRKSNEFKVVTKEIADSCRRILDCCLTTDSGIEHVDINTLMDQYSRGESDFNDLIIDHICKLNNFILVTHDSDFKNSNVAILTTNKRLLSN